MYITYLRLCLYVYFSAVIDVRRRWKSLRDYASRKQRSGDFQCDFFFRPEYSEPTESTSNSETDVQIATTSTHSSSTHSSSTHSNQESTKMDIDKTLNNSPSDDVKSNTREKNKVAAKPNLQCVLHIAGSESIGRIIPFTILSLQNCRNIQKNRMKFKNSKYSHVVLPTRIDGTVGYHSTCYKLYSSVGNFIPKKIKQKYMLTKFTKQENIQITAYVRRHECLWNSDNPLYTNKAFRDRIWTQLARKLNKTGNYFLLIQYS